MSRLEERFDDIQRKIKSKKAKAERRENKLQRLAEIYMAELGMLPSDKDKLKNESKCLIKLLVDKFSLTEEKLTEYISDNSFYLWLDFDVLYRSSEELEALIIEAAKREETTQIYYGGIFLVFDYDLGVIYNADGTFKNLSGTDSEELDKMFCRVGKYEE